MLWCCREIERGLRDPGNDILRTCSWTLFSNSCGLTSNSWLALSLTSLLSACSWSASQLIRMLRLEQQKQQVVEKSCKYFVSKVFCTGTESKPNAIWKSLLCSICETHPAIHYVWCLKRERERETRTVCRAKLWWFIRVSTRQEKWNDFNFTASWHKWNTHLNLLADSWVQFDTFVTQHPWKSEQVSKTQVNLKNWFKILRLESCVS